ncbi:extensin family protein [Agrobacterium cavarae]|uniref:extensin family protein n=1 Tax=Agrobacterium cavarae TaxID=2528239 RepID=UPI0028A79BB8|nr:extensin family protein [Agrobacterium cavarae]
MLHRFFTLAAASLLIAASEPPKQVPVPEAKPQQETPEKATSPEKNEKASEQVSPPPENTVPKPQEKPQTPEPQDASPSESNTPEEKKSEDGKPEADKADQGKPGDAKPTEEKSAEEKKADEPAAEPVMQENPEELKACLSQLKELGAEFREIEPIKGEEDGCGIASPLEVSAVLPGIKLEPKGTMRCEAALALSRWTKDVVIPSAKIAMPNRQVTAFGNASTYICRNRNSAATGKMSEHAKGNAVDIATMTFDKGEPLVMKPRTEDGTMEGAFQRTITTAACLFFRTVLSPGSDATHQDHLHLDVLERKGGYLYCR